MVSYYSEADIEFQAVCGQRNNREEIYKGKVFQVTEKASQNIQGLDSQRLDCFKPIKKFYWIFSYGESEGRERAKHSLNGQ